MCISLTQASADIYDAVSLPPRGRAHVARIPTAAASWSVHVPVGARRTLALSAALARPNEEASDRAAHEAHACVDVGRYVVHTHSSARYSRAVHTMLHLLHVPYAEQLPRASVATDYAPYVRMIGLTDQARQQLWAAQRYDAGGWTGRVTRASTRLVLDGKLHMAPLYAWLPLGPSEHAALRQTMFVQPI